MYEHFEFWTKILLRTSRDLNPGPLAHKRETLRNDLFLSNFTIDFLLEKMKIET